MRQFLVVNENASMPPAGALSEARQQGRSHTDDAEPGAGKTSIRCLSVCAAAQSEALHLTLGGRRMWIITTFGFFSIVEKPEDAASGLLTIRSRVRQDLETLKVRYLPELGPILELSHTDYRYRAQAPHLAVGAAMARAMADVDYSNFKEEVAERQGPSRASIYGKVWSALYRLQE